MQLTTQKIVIKRPALDKNKIITKKFTYIFLFVSINLVQPVFAHEPTKAEWITTTTIGLGSTAAALGLMLVKTPECRWCAPNNFDQTISEKLMWDNLRPIRISSDILAFGMSPLLALGSLAVGASTFKSFGRDALVIFDSFAVTAMLTELAKISFRRARPDAFYNIQHDGQSNRSFWSGHTSLVFSMLTSASVLALRNNSSWAPYILTSSAFLGVLVGYTRIAAARHWMSDVMVGMGVGIGVGVLMPFITRHNSARSPLAKPDAVNFSFAFTW
jgi:membrane-associated phospholipid phosphatase